MFEELNKRRQAVEANIAKSFGYATQEYIVEKAEENDIEKGKWNVGDTFTRHGITYKCTGFSSATGRPTWSRVKDGGGKKESGNSVSEKHMLDYLTTFNSKYTDLSKVTVMKTDKGNWDVSYDGSRLGILGGNQLNEEEVKKLGWIREPKSKKEEADNKLKQYLQKLSPSYTDISKVTAFKMKNGDIAVLYDGNSVATLSSAAGKLLEDAGVKFEEDEAKQKKIITDQLKEDSGEKKEEEKEEQKPKKLSEMKKGDTVALVMERYNPQLGNYVTIQKKQIEGTTSKSFVVDGKKFDKQSGERRDPSSSVYGSSTYSIMTQEDLQKHVKDGKYKGDRISGGNPFEKDE